MATEKKSKEASKRMHGGANGLLMRLLTQSIQETGILDEVGFDKLATKLSGLAVGENVPNLMRHVGEVLDQIRPARTITQENRATLEETTTEKSVAVTQSESASNPQDVSDFADILGDECYQDTNLTDEYNHYLGLRGQMEKCLDEWSDTARKHPYYRRVVQDGVPYMIVGTGTVRNAKRTLHFGATHGNAKKLRDADPDVIVYHSGRPVSVSRDVHREGTTFNGFVWAVRWKNGDAIRYWANKNEAGKAQDIPQGSVRINMTDTEPYFRRG